MRLPWTTRPDGLARVALLLGLLAVLAVGVSQVHSFDVFWQLQSGRYMVETGQFIRTDLFTLAPDVPRFEHTWLHNLVFYASWALGGYVAISFLKGMLVLSTLVALVATARIRGASWLAICCVLPAYCLTSGAWLERPQLWTFLLFAVFLLLLERTLRYGSRAVFWLLPLAVLWVNLHAGSILALALMAAYFFGEAGQALLQRQGDKRRLVRLGLVSLLICGAGLITPYPSRWYATLSTIHRQGGQVDASGTATGPMTALFNMDWTATHFTNEPQFFYAIGMTALVMLLGLRRLRLRDIFLLGGLALMGMKLVRHIPFFYMGIVAVLPVHLDAAVRQIQPRLPEGWRRSVAMLVLAAAVLLFVEVWTPVYRQHGLFKVGLRAWHYPVEAAEFVQDNRLPANLYNTYDWGGYLAWKLYPEYKVFWDGRQNSHEMFRLGWNVMAGQPDWKRILDQFKVNTIVTRASTIDTGQRYPLLDRLRESRDWSLVFNDESSMVFVRDAAVAMDWLNANRRPKADMDDTILSEARLMVSVNPRRYKAWWEIARIQMQRREYQEAFEALTQYLSRTPSRDLLAERYYSMLAPKFANQAPRPAKGSEK